MITIILIIFTILAFVAFFPSRYTHHTQYLYFGFALVLILIAGLRGEGVDRDYSNYIILFKNYNTNLVEPLFYIISYIVHNFLFSNPTFLFVIFAFIGISSKLWAIKQLSEFWVLSLVIYLGGFFILHDLTQIRVCVASGFLLLCIKPIYERNWKLFLLFSSVAISSHYSAILILPLWFINVNKPRKIYLLIALPISYIIHYIIQYTGINIIGTIPIPYIKEKIAVYQILQTAGIDGFDKINVFNSIHLFRIALYYLFIFKLDLLIEKNKYTILLVKIFTISLCSFILFAFMPVIGFRMSELFGIVEIILIPLILYIFKQTYISRLIVVLIGLLLLLTNLFYNNIVFS